MVEFVFFRLLRGQEERQLQRFNARDFDALRDLLAEDVRLDLVNRLSRQGRGDVGEYFERYASAHHWHGAPGFVDGRPAFLVLDPADLDGPPTYFILLEWADARITGIRDFLFARYAMEGAQIAMMDREA